MQEGIDVGYLVELVPILLVIGIFWLIWQRSQASAHERIELGNLRAFKDRVRDAAMNEIEIDSASALGRIVLDEVHQVDVANSARRELP